MRISQFLWISVFEIACTFKVNLRCKKFFRWLVYSQNFCANFSVFQFYANLAKFIWLHSLKFEHKNKCLDRVFHPIILLKRKQTFFSWKSFTQSHNLIFFFLRNIAISIWKFYFWLRYSYKIKNFQGTREKLPKQSEHIEIYSSLREMRCGHYVRFYVISCCPA